MENNKHMDEGAKGSCGCGNCGGCWGHGMRGQGHGGFLARWFLGLIILWVVFWVGVKIGEFKEEFGGGYGGRHMRYDYGNQMYQNMMQWQKAQEPAKIQ